MFKFNIGNLKVSRIEEFVEVPIDPNFLLPDLPISVIEENLDWLVPNFYNQKNHTIDIHIQSWVIETPDHIVLVDACGGNCKPRPFFPSFDMRVTPYLENLAAAGYKPEDIDFVFCTHLHIDHVGWNTRLENGVWVPTFPNAKYLWSEAEYNHANPEFRADTDKKETDEIFFDSVLPIVQAGLSQHVNGVHAITSGLYIEPAPGHSPGHCILRAKSEGETGLFTGDCMHHPLQIIAPKYNSFACEDADMAIITRVKILEECAEHGHLLIPAHFAAPHVGRVIKKGDKFNFVEV
ncbi:MAG: MBL fold metallo-hydrolase [Caulobacterales bacterium]|nr:MBL fold metallo-hydrolase [Caulobacterales bacterium]